MPATLVYTDLEVIDKPPAGRGEPIPVTLGPDWRPGDIRLMYLGYSTRYFVPEIQPDGSVRQQIRSIFHSIANLPSGWALGFGTTASFSDPISALYWKRLEEGDTDGSIAFPKTATLNWFTAAFATIRGVDPSTDPVFFNRTAPQNQVINPQRLVLSAITVPNYAGELAIFVASGPGRGNYFNTAQYPNWPVSWTSGSAIGLINDFTHIVASDRSGKDFYPYNGNSCVTVQAKKCTSGETVPNPTMPVAYCTDTYSISGTASVDFQTAIGVYFRPAPDVSPSMTGASETDTSSAIAFDTTGPVAPPMTGASEIDTAKTALNPLEGFWISDPLELPGDPITASRMRWNAVVPDGAELDFATSINNGASWDTAENLKAVPRLRTGDTVTRRLLIRMTLRRPNTTVARPRVFSLKVQVTTDAGTYEWVPTFYGRVQTADRISSATANGGGSTGGGGQVGGGTSIKVKATDLSRTISRRPWSMPYSVGSGQNYGATIEAMVRNRLPEHNEFLVSSTEQTTVPMIFGTSPGAADAWKDIAETATAVGHEAFFRPDRPFVFQPIPDPRYGDPVLVIGPDSNPRLISVKDSTTDEQTINHYVIRGESTSSANPVVGEAEDDDPSSLTYVDGEYGRVTKVLTFSTVKDEEQAKAVAKGLLFNSLGRANTVTIKMVFNPALNTGDVVRIDMPELRLVGSFLVQALPHKPCSPGEEAEVVLFRQSTQ